MSEYALRLLLDLTIMVLSLDSLPLRKSDDHWQELQLLCPSNMPFSQRSRPAQRAGRAGAKIGHEQSGTQWEQESDGSAAGQGKDEIGGICGAAGIICVCVTVRQRRCVVQTPKTSTRLTRVLFHSLTLCRVNCLAALSKCSNLRHLDLSFVSESISMSDLLRSTSLLSKLESLHLRMYSSGSNYLPWA